jgi:hypothetical protein
MMNNHNYGFAAGILGLMGSKEVLQSQIMEEEAVLKKAVDELSGKLTSVAGRRQGATGNPAVLWNSLAPPSVVWNAPTSVTNARRQGMFYLKFAQWVTGNQAFEVPFKEYENELASFSSWGFENTDPADIQAALGKAKLAYLANPSERLIHPAALLNLNMNLSEVSKSQEYTAEQDQTRAVVGAVTDTAKDTLVFFQYIGGFFTGIKPPGISDTKWNAIRFSVYGAVGLGVTAYLSANLAAIAQTFQSDEE